MCMPRTGREAQAGAADRSAQHEETSAPCCVPMHLVRPLIILSFAIWAAMCHSAQTGPLGSGAKDDLPEMQPTEGIHALPAGTGEAPELRLGEKMKFDELGPIIITETGEARRIENWKTLTKREQDVAWRRIAERNRRRAETLAQDDAPAEL